MNYCDVFQCMKGVGEFNLSSWIMPVLGTDYVLEPICCRSGMLDVDVINMLTNGRNANVDNFLNHFKATQERTRDWLKSVVANDRTRILFSLKNIYSNELYGYMGLAYGNEDHSSIECDAIVRYTEKVERGLMRLAFTQLVKWVYNDLSVKSIWVRVFSDNAAVGFYESCSFVIKTEKKLFCVLDESGDLVRFTDTAEEMVVESSRSLLYMKYTPI